MADTRPDERLQDLQSTTPEEEALAGTSAIAVEPPGEEEPAPSQLAAGIGMFGAFRYRNYRFLWVGDICTAAAQWIQQVSINWVVYDLTGSGSALGAINGMRVIPTLLVSPLAGVASDRLPRNRIIASSQLAMFFITFLLALGLYFHIVEIWHLFVFTLLIGAAQSINMPARQTIVFDLVPRHVVPNAVALSWLAFSLARSIGPAIGGLMIVVFGPANNFLLQSLAYLSVMTTVLMVRMPPRAPQPPRRWFIHDLKEGYGYALREPRARLMVLITVVSPLFIIPLHWALLPIFAKKTFHGDAATLGILVGAIGFGGLIGGLLTASFNRIDRRGLMQLFAVMIFAMSECLFTVVASTTGQLLLAIPFLVCAGAAESVYTTTNTSVLQLLAPEHLRGSMTSILQMSFVFAPLGALYA
ncbi:MAG TPA: MFS transporter, partial [Dehalococcoidia bacterium]|nr:MFS transporter [Dehalococcoidia bacterium]